MAEETPIFPWSVLSPSDEWQQRTILVYGPSGVGKTRLSAQFPDPLLLSCDPGVLGGALSAAQFHVKHLKVTSYKEVLNLLPVLKQNAGVEFKTLVIDSISYLGKIVLNDILTNVQREIPRFEEWNLNATRLRRLIDNFCSMNCHVVFTAVDSTTKDEVSGKISGGPALPGQLQKELPQAVDVVARLYAQTGYGADGKLKVTYKMTTAPDSTWFAKDRTQKLPIDCVIPADDSISIFKPLFKAEEFTKGA